VHHPELQQQLGGVEKITWNLIMVKSYLKKFSIEISYKNSEDSKYPYRTRVDKFLEI